MHPQQIVTIIITIFVTTHIVFSGADSSTPRPNSDGNVYERTKLFQTLFTNYDKRVNPDNVTVKFGISLINFRVNDEDKTLDSNVWLKYDWIDERLKWEPEQHANISVLRVDVGEVWKPDITLYNSADPIGLNMINCWHSNVLLFPAGEVLWVPPCKLSSKCDFSLKMYPYEEQTCSLKFGSWTYSENELDMRFYNKTRGFDLEDLSNLSGFEIVETTGFRSVRTYSCCPNEPYVDLTYEITVKRIPGEELVKRF